MQRGFTDLVCRVTVPIMRRQDLVETAAWYRRFAEVEAARKSPLYADLAVAVSSDSDVLQRLGTLRPSKRQPNLLLASYRWHHGVPRAFQEFRSQLLDDWTRISTTMLERSTQTNEPARCATLMPLLARLPQPLALIEVGAAAGLCLYPDRYGYRWNECLLLPGGEGAPVFACDVNERTPIPAAHPKVVWRAGLDLHPLDVANPEDMRWLETLVWPGQEDRRKRLGAAIAIAQAEPPELQCGDLLDDIASLVNRAPTGATRVLFHSAVLNYTPDQQRREEFARAARQLADVWIANEAPHVFPGLAPTMPAPRTDAFHVTLNGQSIAWADPHGAALWWTST